MSSFFATRLSCAVTLFAALLGAGAYGEGQCPLPASDFLSAAPEQNKSEKPVPEDGVLSETTYTSLFFSFAIELPLSPRGHLVKLPLMPPRQHALLALAFEGGGHSGSITIDAIEPQEGLDGSAAEDWRQRDMDRLEGRVSEDARATPGQSTVVGPSARSPLHLPATNEPWRAPTFHSTTHHNGGSYTATYWTRINDYRVGVLVKTNDAEFMRKAKQAMAAARFHCPDEQGRLVSGKGTVVKPEGEAYQGPTVPTWHVDAVLAATPALDIAPGEIQRDVYRDPELGLEYTIPGGWDFPPAGTAGTPSSDLTSLRQFQFFHACSRTLLRLRQRSTGSMIVLRAMDPVCLAIRMPGSAADERAAEEVEAGLEALSEMGEFSGTEMMTIAGRLFLVLHGTIAASGESAGLAQRLTQTVFLTRQKKLLLAWSVAAPTQKELNALSLSGIRLDGAAEITLATSH